MLKLAIYSSEAEGGWSSGFRVSNDWLSLQMPRVLPHDSLVGVFSLCLSSAQRRDRPSLARSARVVQSRTNDKIECGDAIDRTPGNTDGELVWRGWAAMAETREPRTISLSHGTGIGNEW